jgi:hypothetical protein
MSIMQFLNGMFHNETEQEIMSAFLEEQGLDLTDAIQAQLLAALEAQLEGKLESAIEQYLEILDLVGNSDVISQQVIEIQRRQGHVNE